MSAEAMKTTQDYFGDYLVQDKTRHTLLDLRDVKFTDETERDRLFQIALGFSIRGELPHEQIVAFLEYLNITEITGETRAKIESLAGGLNLLETRKQKGIEKKIVEIAEKQAGKLTAVQKNLLEQFLAVLNNEIAKIKKPVEEKNGGAKKKEKRITNPEELALELQKASLEKIVTGIENASKYWEEVFKEQPLETPTFKTLIRLDDLKKTKKEIQDLSIKAKEASDLEKISKTLGCKTKWIHNLFQKLQNHSKGCAFLKVITAAIKAEQLEFAELAEKTEQLSQILIDKNGFTMEKTDEKQQLKKDEWRTVKKNITTYEKNADGQIKKTTKMVVCEQRSREKKIHRRMTKLLSEPEYDPGKAIKDGIGLRFEVHSKEDAIRILKDFFNKKAPLFPLLTNTKHELKVKTRALLDREFKNEKQVMHGEAERDKAVIFPIELLNHGEEALVIEGSKKSKFFKDIRIVGYYEGLGNFEIQFVLVGNENETGLAHHKIWKAVCNAEAKARVFGFVTKEDLDVYCEEAFFESTDETEIKKIIKKALKSKKILKRYEQSDAKEKKINDSSITVTEAEVNQSFAEWKKAREDKIMQRLKENALEFKPGKFVYAEKSNKFKYRLLETDLISQEDQEKIKKAGFKKWVEEFYLDGVFYLGNPLDFDLKEYEVASFEELPAQLKADLFDLWKKFDKKEGNVLFEEMENNFEFEEMENNFEFEEMEKNFEKIKKEFLEKEPDLELNLIARIEQEERRKQLEKDVRTKTMLQKKQSENKK